MESGTETDVNIQAPVVRRPVSANLGLNFNTGFFFFSSKAFSRIIFSILLEYPIIKMGEKRIKLNLFFKLSYLTSSFALFLGYLNPASNNPAQGAVVRRPISA